MAIGTLLSVAQTLLSELQSSELRKAIAIFRLKSQPTELEKTVQTINVVLRHAESQLELPDAVQSWMEKVKDVFFEAEDLFDEVITVVKQKQLLKGDGNLSKKVSNLFTSSINPLSFAYRMSRRIKEIKNKLDAVAADKCDFNFNIDYQPPIMKKRSEACSSYVNEADIIGREHDLQIIIDKLLASNDESDVSVLPIVGMCGSGKTTLAQLVYNHPKVTDAFQLKMWTCVGNEDWNELVKDILVSITNEIPDQSSTMDKLQIQLREQLTGKKYLLVLDDLWNEDPHQWCELKKCLSRGAKGSWIVVTTRSQTTAQIAGGRTHELSGLSDKDSWCLFKRMAFASDHSNPPDDELVMIGKKIVHICAGVPVAIRVAGRLFYGQEKTKWLSIQETVLSNLKHKVNGVMGLLELSFHHLESPLKDCLRYLALFPKGHVIEKQMLISLWMAQGYIVPLRESQSMEDAAQEYFTILLHRCFFQDVRQDVYGEIIYCEVHDLIHDLACCVAGKEMCLIGNQFHFDDRNPRHLTLLGTTDVIHVICPTQIRSLLHVGGLYKDFKMDQSKLGTLIKNCKGLRALDLSNWGVEKLPDSIGKLLHLRYLDLSQNRDLKVLPKDITSLVNLQTLILRGCHGLTKLPEDLSKLTNLRVLDIQNCFDLTCMPSDLHKLTNLHTLTEFVLGETCFGWFDQLEDLKALQNLRGQLTICIKNARDARDAMKYARREGAYLVNMEYLKEIRFFFTGEYVDERDHEEVLGVLQPHANIKGLDLRRYDGAYLPGWTTFLPNLVNLYITNCRQLLWLPYMGNLFHLKVFHLVHLPHLEYIFEYSTASASGSSPSISAPAGLQSAEVASLFPSLEQLHLIDLPKLKGWFRTEVDLGVEDEHMLVGIGSKVHVQSLFRRQLESLIIERCSELQHVPLGAGVEELSTCGAGTSSTKESINPAIEETYDLKVIEESEADSSLPDLSLSLNVHPPLNSALPPSMVADDAAYTLPLSSDLQFPPQPAPPFDDPVVDDALLYCALFPPDYEFEKNALLQLWVADGIFNEEPMEEIAGLFFEYYRSRGYFEVSRIIFLTGEAMYTFKGGNHLVPEGSHVKWIEDAFNSNDLSLEVSHVSVSSRSLNDASDLCQFERFKQLRALIFLQGHLLSFRQLPRDFFLSVKLLRALDLSHTHFVELPSSLGNMKCLRYLDLTKTPIKHLPEALDCLENLQSLKLRGCSSLSTLPKGMRRLEKLRHLEFDVLRQLRSMPEGMGALTSLRTLSAFIVGVEEGRSIRQLKNLNNLSGSFCISGLQNVLTENEGMEAYLCHKSQLRKLELRWSDSQDTDVIGCKEVLSSLQPNASLEELCISCYGGSELPYWICDTAFCRLVSITLFKCENCLVLPSVGQLPALKALKIVGFEKLKVIDHNFYGGFGIQGYIAFPKLEKLTIQNMLSLEEWSDIENSHFPQLSSLTVKHCPELLSLSTVSSLHSLKELEIAHCGTLASCLDEEVPSSLETFIIEECPLITARIVEYEDQGWLKLLAEIPNVWIDHQKIFGLNSSEESEEETEEEEEEETESEEED